MTKVSRKEPYGIPLGKRRLKKALEQGKRDKWFNDYVSSWLNIDSIFDNPLWDGPELNGPVSKKKTPRTES